MIQKLTGEPYAIMSSRRDPASSVREDKPT